MTPETPVYHHVSLLVASADVSAAFYGGLFGFIEALRHDGDDGKVVVHLRQPATRAVIELIQDGGRAPPATEHVHLGFGVADLDRFEARLRELGAPLARERITIGAERMIFLRDPDHYLIEVNDHLSS